MRGTIFCFGLALLLAGCAPRVSAGCPPLVSAASCAARDLQADQLQIKLDADKAKFDARLAAWRDESKKDAAKLEATMDAERAEWKKADAKYAVQQAASKAAAAKQAARPGVRIGMNPSEVKASSWGNPRHINRTTTVYGEREQWVYGGGYLYFTNGILTAIQN